MMTIIALAARNENTIKITALRTRLSTATGSLEMPQYMLRKLDGCLDGLKHQEIGFRPWMVTLANFWIEQAGKIDASTPLNNDDARLSEFIHWERYTVGSIESEALELRRRITNTYLNFAYYTRSTPSQTEKYALPYALICNAIQYELGSPLTFLTRAFHDSEAKFILTEDTLAAFMTNHASVVTYVQVCMADIEAQVNQMALEMESYTP